MDLLFSFHAKHYNKMKSLQSDGLGLAGDVHFLVIRLNNSWILRLLARALVLALTIVSFPWLNTMIGESWSILRESSNISDIQTGFDPISVDLLPLVFHDLANEGLLRRGDRALFLSGEGDEEAVFNSQVITDHNMDLVSVSDIMRQGVISKETYDFAFAHGLTTTSDFVNRALKSSGILVLQLADDPAVGFQKPSNYKIVYLRRFDSTIVAMKKQTDSETTDSSDPSPKRRLLGIESEEARVAALNNLEDVLLEPPRAASGKSSSYRKRTRYLPDLMGVSLENYPRRVFIDVSLGSENDASAWFTKHYPSQNSKFEIFQVEAVTTPAAEAEAQEAAPVIGMSEWLRKNVKESDYVVMKTEVEVAEEMVKNRAIRLVDELFLECKHQGIKKGGEKSRRAYWECLAFYGLLRDEGVAVHQWWG